MEVDSAETSGGAIGTLSGEDLGRVLESYRPWCRVFVRQALFAQVGRRVDESDVIQSTWLDIVRKIDQFQGRTEAEFFGWIRTCLQNNVKNVIRDNLAAKRDVRRENAISMEMESASLHWFQPVASTESPSDHFIRGENALALSKALEELPEQQRIAVELRHLAGLKLSEVAEEMGKTADAAMALIRRGVKALNAKLPTTTFS